MLPLMPPPQMAPAYGPLEPASHLLGGADGTHAHADPQSVDAGLDEVGRLPGRDDVAADDVDLGVLSLDELDHLVLVHGVSLGRVDHDHIHARLQKKNPTAPCSDECGEDTWGEIPRKHHARKAIKYKNTSHPTSKIKQWAWLLHHLLSSLSLHRGAEHAVTAILYFILQFLLLL